MSQNRSSAVMQQRSEPHDSLDDFPTPPWATRALCEFLTNGPPSLPLDMFSCREPAANRGHMVKPLREYFGRVEASDIHDYGAGFPVQDFLFPFALPEVDWTITNPPFRLAAQFVDRALETSRQGVAMILRSAFLEGQERFEELFAIRPPAYVLQLSARCGMFKGRVMKLGTKYLDRKGIERSASTATSYAWLVWMHGEQDTRLRWLAPSRAPFERPGDYPTPAEGIAA